MEDQHRARCGRCGSRLARDNRSALCGACQSARRDQHTGPLEVPAQFWYDPAIRQASGGRHMGRLIRAYRMHPHHGRHPLPQDVIAGWVGITQAQLSRIESGSPIVHLDRLIQWARTLRIPAELLWFRMPEDADPPEPTHASEKIAGSELAESADPVVLRIRLHGEDVLVRIDRRTFLRAGMGGLVEAFALNAGLPDSDLETGRVPDRLTLSSPAQVSEVLDHLREHWHLLVKTDNLLGPRFALTQVYDQIAIIEALLRSLRDGARLEAVRLGSQYAESAAWLCEDSGHLAQAQQWTSRAMEWAYEAGDQNMLAWTVFRRSQQAAAVADPAQVISLAQAARREEDGLLSPMRAAIRVQEARGYALDRDGHRAQTLLDEAHQWAASDTEGDARGGHGSFCTPSYIEIHRAGCLLAVGDASRAVRLYEAALPDLPPVYQRDRAAALGGLAAAYAADGQLEQAASTARAALPIARSAGSRRIVGELMAVGQTLMPQRHRADVAELLHELHQGEA
jgi:tetratricopeptide (TPR) repeat protein/transcriptional regulator with XRE-family HTH domain